MKYQNECCSVCESYGQNLPQCKCMTDAECTEHIIKLAKKAVKKSWFISYLMTMFFLMFFCIIFAIRLESVDEEIRILKQKDIQIQKIIDEKCQETENRRWRMTDTCLDIISNKRWE